MAKSNEKIKVADLSKLEATLKAKNMAEEEREEILNLAEKRQKKIIESNKQEERLKGIQSKGGATKFFKKAELIKKIQARDLEEFFKKYENEDGKTYDKLVEAMFPGFEDYKNEKITDEEEKRLTAKEDKRIQDFKDQKAAHEAKLQARRKDLEKYLESLKKEEEEGEELLKQEKINEEKKKKNRTKTKKVTAPEPVTAKPEEENLISITLVDGEIRNLKKGDKFYNKYDHKNYEIIGPHTSKDGKALIKAVNVEKRDETFFTTKEEFATNFDKGTFDIPADDERVEKLNNIFTEEKNRLQEEQERELSGEILVTVNNLDDIPVNLRRGDMFWYKHKQYRITKEGTRKTKKEDKLLILAENADNASEVLELTPEEFVNDYNENRISIKPSDKIREEMKNFERERKAREALNSTPEKIEENVAKIAELIKEFGISQVVIHSGVDFDEKDGEGNKKFTEAYFNQKKKDQKFQNPWTADLDTQAALLILNEFNEKSLGKIYTENAVSSYIPKGGKEKNIADKDKRSGVKLFLDVGGNWLRFEKDGENTTIYLDHHGEEKKEPTSAAEMMYKIMNAADLLKEKPEWLNKLVTLVNDVDNLSYLNKKNEAGTKIIDEKYFREVWPNSLYAIAEKIPFKILKEWFESGLIKNADRVFSEKDLRGKIGRTKIRVKEKLVNDKMEVVDIDMTVAQLCKMREREAGGAIKGINNAIEQNKKNNLNTENTRLGKILVHDHFIKEDGKENFILDNVAFTAAKSMGFDTVVNWDPKTKIFKINSSHANLEAIGKELQDEFVGTNVVRGVFVFGPKDKDACENITIERILDIIDRNINKKEEKVPTKNSKENKTTIENPETKNTENTSIEKELSELEKLTAQEDANRIILIEAIKAGNRPEVRRIQELNFAIFKKKKELLNTKIENTENKEEVKIIEEIKENVIEAQENLEKIEVAPEVEKAPEDPAIIIEEKEKEIEISPSGIIRRDPEEILAEPIENIPEETPEEVTPESLPEVKVSEGDLSQEQIEKNKKNIDKLLEEEEKKKIAEEAEQVVYNDKAREVLVEETNKYQWLKDIKIKEGLEKIVKKFRLKLLVAIAAGGISIGATGVHKDKEGHLTYDFKNILGIGKAVEYFQDPESKPQKVITYLQNAPWANPTEIDDYFKRISDTKNRSEGTGVVQAPVANEQDNPLKSESMLDTVKKIKAAEEAAIKAAKDSIEAAQIKEVARINAEIEKVIVTLGGNKTKFHPTTIKNLYMGELYNDANDGLHGRSVLDMSNGVKVIYQPRNAADSKRKDITGVALVSDYLYDMDFTDNSSHEHAKNSLRQLREQVKNKDFSDGRKFVQVRELVPGTTDTYKVSIKPVTELTEQDFKENKVYRQSWARLSDFDISPDGTQIKLTNYSEKFHAALFQRQGLPFHGGNGNEHNLRLPGGVGNHSKYQNISALDQFGAYLGGTATIISDDGKIVKKVTGSLRDIVTIALEIKKQTGGKDVHFLQSDAGSMNVKAIADEAGNISKSKLAITRNKEPWAGASELYLRNQD